MYLMNDIELLRFFIFKNFYPVVHYLLTLVEYRVIFFNASVSFFSFLISYDATDH